MTRAPSTFLVGLYSLFALLTATLGVLPSTAVAAPELFDISIVEIAGRPGHQGFFPIQDLPVQGATAIARVRLNGDATSVALMVRDNARNVLSQITMLVPPATRAVAGTYFAEFVVPTVPFSLSATGIDSSGKSFEIPTSNAVTVLPQTLDLRLVPTVAELSPGLPVLFSVQVTNHGAADTISVALTSDAGGTVIPASAQLSLAADETTGVNFTFTPPPTTSTLVAVTIRATASSTTGTGSRNEASLELSMSLGPQSQLTAWPKRHRTIDTDDRDPTVIWICNANVDVQTILLAYDLAPINIKTVNRHQEEFEHGGHESFDGSRDSSDNDRGRCGASSLTKLSFDTSNLVTELENNVFPSQTDNQRRRINAPITAYATDGTRLVGYVSLWTRLPRPAHSKHHHAK